MFLDASVIVAILKGEEGSDQILARIEDYQGRVFTSPTARFETVVSIAVALAKGKGQDHPTPELFADVERIVDQFLERVKATEVAISGAVGKLAIEAAATYGKMSGHPAKLNFGDCFAYACAKAYRLRLVYKGDDFAKTDLA